jgi:4-hydroxythreonine-4-phosphate dehydrogenase
MLFDILGVKNMKNRTQPVLGITMGDPTGAGPEIIVKALHSSPYRAVVIGDAAVMQAAVEIVKLPIKIKSIKKISEADFADGTIEVIDLHNVDMKKLVRGKVSPIGGSAAYDYIETATKLALAKEIAAIVTAPLNKEALNLAGYDYPGHTEILAHLCNVSDDVMMLVAGDLRVSHVTTHVSLRQACDLVKKDRIIRVLQLTNQAIRKMVVTKPRLAVSGLNPHAGEGGLFGNEEIEEIAPAVADARASGLNVVGPLPPDTVFWRAGQGEFDAVIAMYHDQGHIALKMADFERGVNVTLGLPIIRTSVDHGTVFDKAGKGTANPTSMIEAMKLAGMMSLG